MPILVGMLQLQVGNNNNRLYYPSGLEESTMAHGALTAAACLGHHHGAV
jgi:hypothetical protein